MRIVPEEAELFARSSRHSRFLRSNCLDREQRILEYALTDIPSPRCSPHDSRYLRAVGSGRT